MNYFKAITLTLTFTCFAVLSFGQTEKGRILIGGSSGLNFSSVNSKIKSPDLSIDAGKSSEFELSPQVGFFVADGFVLGFQIPVTISKQSDDNSEYSNSMVAFAPMARYYLGKTNIKPYLQGSIGFGSMTVKVFSEKSSVGITLYHLGGGLGIFLNKYVSLDLGLGYNSTESKNKENSDVKSVSSGISANAGLIIHI